MLHKVVQESLLLYFLIMVLFLLHPMQLLCQIREICCHSTESTASASYQLFYKTKETLTVSACLLAVQSKLGSSRWLQIGMCVADDPRMGTMFLWFGYAQCPIWRKIWSILCWVLLLPWLLHLSFCLKTHTLRLSNPHCCQRWDYICYSIKDNKHQGRLKKHISSLSSLIFLMSFM